MTDTVSALGWHESSAAHVALQEWLLPDSVEQPHWRGTVPPQNWDGFYPVRHLLDAGLFKPQGPSGPQDDVFFCLWVSRPRDDVTSLHFIFEGASDAPLHSIRAIELLIGAHRIEAPVEHLTERTIKALCRAPLDTVLDRERRAVNGPIRLRPVFDS